MQKYRLSPSVVVSSHRHVGDGIAPIGVAGAAAHVGESGVDAEISDRRVRDYRCRHKLPFLFNGYGFTEKPLGTTCNLAEVSAIKKASLVPIILIRR